MYDNKKIKLLRRGNLEVSELGVPSYEFVIIGEYNCDVQPISADKCTKIFGVFPNVKYQIWLESKIEGFNDDTIQDFKVIYKNKEFRICKLIEWDDDDWYCLNFCIERDSIGSDNSES